MKRCLFSIGHLDDGVRRMAVAVLQQAISDLDNASSHHRLSAEAFIAREDFD